MLWMMIKTRKIWLVIYWISLAISAKSLIICRPQQIQAGNLCIINSRLIPSTNSNTPIIMEIIPTSISLRLSKWGLRIKEDILDIRIRIKVLDRLLRRIRLIVTIRSIRWLESMQLLIWDNNSNNNRQILYTKTQWWTPKEIHHQIPRTPNSTDHPTAETTITPDTKEAINNDK